MKYDYDLICIGLGPGGIYAAQTSAAMGLKTLAIESGLVGGSCVNTSSVPVKLFLTESQRYMTRRNSSSEGHHTPDDPSTVFETLRAAVKRIREKKTLDLFSKVDMVLGEGDASFIDRHMIRVGNKTYSSKYIVIASGSKPSVPSIPGLSSIDFLTHENIFDSKKMPRSVIIIGSSVGACEFAQAFSRFGTRVSIVHMERHLVDFGDPDASWLLEEQLREDEIDIHNARKIERIEKRGEHTVVTLEGGSELIAEKILVATGRRMAFTDLNLDSADVDFTEKGITVNKYLQTSQPHIYAVGDCNGIHFHANAAMHQGLISVMNAVCLRPFKRDFRKDHVPWAIFTDPQIAHVGKTSIDLVSEDIEHETVSCRFENYAVGTARNMTKGFLKVYTGKRGQIYGATIVGEGAGEVINEWSFAMQHNLKLGDVIMTQHAYPSSGYISKLASDQWMLNRSIPLSVRKLGRWLFRL